MAEKNDASLIGYDPLAWLGQEAEAQEAMSEAAQVQIDVPVAEMAAVTENLTLSQDLNFVGQSVDVERNELSEELTQFDQSVDIEPNIILDPVLNIRNVAELYTRVCLALESNEKIEIDASAVSVIDTANLQLLLILKQTAVKLKKQVNIDFPSEKFIEACKLLGLDEMLEVNHAASGIF